MEVSQRSLNIRPSTVLAIAATMTAALFAPPVQAGTIRHDRSDWEYRNLANAFPSVGYLSARNSSKSWGCSGTLIARSYVLTAAHCVESGGWLNQGTFWLGNQSYSVNAFAVNGNWLNSGRNLGLGVDLAILSLTSNAWNANPAILYTGRDEDLKLGTYVGYGATGTGITGTSPNSSSGGTKRAGQNTMGIGTRLGQQNGISYTDNLLVSDFDDPRTAQWYDPLSQPQNLEYQVAWGDSGGGMFIDGRVAGVNSFIGDRDGILDADYGDTSASVRVSSWASWIRGTANYLAQTLGRSNPTIASSGGTTSNGQGWNRQADAPLADEYNWFDDRYFAQMISDIDIDLEQYASGSVFDGETLLEVTPPESQSIPEPGMVFGLASLVGFGWFSRKRHNSV